jgi:hypothetical protein
LMRRQKQAEIAAENAENAEARKAFEQEIRNWQNCLTEAVANIPTPDGSTPLLWYVRRRSIAYRSQVEGLAIKVSGDDVASSAMVNANVTNLGLQKRLTELSGKATPEANARVAALLSAPRVAASDVLTAAIVGDLEKVAAGTIETVLPKPDITRATATPGIASPFNAMNIAGLTRAPLDIQRMGAGRISEATLAGRSTAVRTDTKLGLSENEVLDLASDYGSNRLGEGIAAIESVLGKEWPDAKQAVFLGDASLALPIDNAFQRVKPELLAELAKALGEAVKKKDVAAVRDVLTKAGS